MSDSLSRRHLVCSAVSATLTASDLLTAHPSQSDITSMTLEDVSAHIRRRSLSPVEVTRACLDRIERLNPKINAFAIVTSEQAMSQARTAEKEIQTGKWRGPLHGIPVGIKDNIDVADVPTSEALSVLRDRIPAEDSE